MKTKQIKFLIVAFLMTTVMQGCKKAAPDPMPVADFIYSQSADGAIQFTNKSTSGRSYAWDFGNGTTSTDQNPKVVYTNNGDYVVKLSVKNSTGDNSVTKTITVTTGRDLPINADFTFSLLANGEVQFTDKSTSASTYSWDFGYGLTSTEKSPKVTLTYNGDYKVKLTAIGKFLTDIASVEKTVTITNGKAVPSVSDEYNSTKGTSGGNSYTFRNHIYTFDVTEDNKIVTANIQSADVDVAFFWYSPLGQDLNNYPQFYGPKTSRNFTDIQKLNKGKYTLVVTTKDRYAIGKYTLSIRGIDAAPVRVASARLLSTNKDFADGGGGTGAGNENFSPRNKTYTFDVTEDNTYVDIDVTSTSADTWVKLFDNLGQSQNYASIGAGRTPNVNLKVNKGTYTLLVGTLERLAKTNFSLEVNGKIQNLKEKVASVLKVDDKWQKTKTVEIEGSTRSYDEYSFEITEDKSWIDVGTESTHTHGVIVKNSIGQEIEKDVYFEKNTRKVIAQVSKGIYKIFIYTRNEVSSDAYSFSLVGQVSNLKKL